MICEAVIFLQHQSLLNLPRTIQRYTIRRLVQLAISLLFTAAVLGGDFRAQEKVAARPILTRIRWSTPADVTQCRLQIARDQNFTDIVFDGVVSGGEYVTEDLLPGRYYWRVARRGRRIGPFSRPVTLDIKVEAPTESGRRPESTRPTNPVPGWMAATGDVLMPQAAQLRKGMDDDFIGVSSEGTVYALDGSNGLALWTSRFNLSGGSDEPQPVLGSVFAPVLMSSRGGTPKVVVAFAKGVRALDGATGRELWRTILPAHPIGGVAFDLDSRPAVYLATDQTKELIVLDGETGAIKLQRRLTGRPIAAPVLLQKGTQRDLVIASEDGQIEVRNSDAELLHTISIGSEITTAPVILQSSRGPLLVVGTRGGLVVCDTASFELNRIELGGSEYPKGALSVADLEHNGKMEVVMITGTGQAIAADVAEGKIKWRAEGASEAMAVAFGDLDGDGAPDVLVPASKNFAIGLSGRDGSMIWKAVDGYQSQTVRLRPRALATSATREGGLRVVGADPGFPGLRAFELPRNAARAASQ